MARAEKKSLDRLHLPEDLCVGSLKENNPCCSTRARFPSCLCSVDDIPNIRLEEIRSLFVCLGKDMQGIEGSGPCARPQDIAASFKDLRKMAAAPCFCWPLFSLHPDEKNL